MADKVYDGTPKGSSSLCAICRYAHNVYGINRQQTTLCRQSSRRVAFPVERCSMFEDKRLPSLPDMYDIAWEVKCRRRGPAGFAEGTDLEIKIVPPERGMPDQPSRQPSTPAGERGEGGSR